MKDCSASAEALFREFARRHAFAIQKIDEPNVELLMRVKPQSGLSFELTLGLQNNDELNIGFEGFWSHFFPCESKLQIVSDALDGIVTGECRLAIHKQWNAVVRRVLEQRTTKEWKPLYTDYARVQMPFLRAKVSYLYNDRAQKR